ncbi:MAG: hypothetical protein LBF36_02935, partial [Mycoplasmataceae bacterium]|nr:hypothetical protein [Mycoplasmataceae bacterium]
GDLPNGFHFDGKTLTFDGKTAPSDYGTVKLKATAYDGSGKTKVFDIHYYNVETIDEDKCALLLCDGRVEYEDVAVSEDGTLTFPSSTVAQDITNGVYFCGRIKCPYQNNWK